MEKQTRAEGSPMTTMYRHVSLNVRQRGNAAEKEHGAIVKSAEISCLPPSLPPCSALFRPPGRACSSVRGYIREAK